MISLAVFAGAAAAQPPAPVVLNWLDGKPPAVPQSVSWGVPWPKGAVQKSDALVLKTADGTVIPAQVWPLAYWPDGSVMWSGQSIAATPNMAGPLQLAVGAAAEPSVKVTCAQDDQAITIDTGAIQVRVPKQGSSLVESITAGGRKVA
ncbi:MAG: Tat pathway signal sequence domain protein, partial [Opitutaceae bacterium]